MKAGTRVRTNRDSLHQIGSGTVKEIYAAIYA